MDYEQELQWRRGARRRHGMSETACEFMRHAGRYLLIDWAPHPIDDARIQIRDEAPVRSRFDSVAAVMSEMMERYYHQLYHPTNGFHAANVKNAILLSTGCVRAVRDWMGSCSASPEAISKLFFIVRDAVGGIATSPSLIDDIAIDRIEGEVILALCDGRRRAGCFDLRFAA